jgi:hypothetical protein
MFQQRIFKLLFIHMQNTKNDNTMGSIQCPSLITTTTTTTKNTNQEQQRTTLLQKMKMVYVCGGV